MKAELNINILDCLRDIDYVKIIIIKHGEKMYILKLQYMIGGKIKIGTLSENFGDLN